MSEQDAAPARAVGDSAGLVKCRVLPMGHEQIHTGETEVVDGVSRPTTFKRGDHFSVARSIAVAQERAGRVEIVGGK